MWPLRLEEESLLRGLKRVPAAMKLMSLWSLCNETNTRRCGHWTHWHTTGEPTALLPDTRGGGVCAHVCPQVQQRMWDMQYSHWDLLFGYYTLLVAVICRYHTVWMMQANTHNLSGQLKGNSTLWCVDVHSVLMVHVNNWRNTFISAFCIDRES